MTNLKEEKGITLVLLVITIIVIIIIAGIAIYGGTESIKKAKLENIKTDMMLIKAKAKEYVEKATFEMGKNPTEEKKEEIRNKLYVQQETGLGLTKESTSNVPDGNTYKVGSEALTKMGLNNIDEDEYYVVFDEDNVTVEVYSKTGYNGNYSLTDIEKITVKEVN